jgi:hypothetical protein
MTPVIDFATPQAPDLIEPVIGFRQRRMADDVLASLTREARPSSADRASSRGARGVAPGIVRVAREHGSELPAGLRPPRVPLRRKR